MVYPFKKYLIKGLMLSHIRFARMEVLHCSLLLPGRTKLAIAKPFQFASLPIN